MSRNSDVVLSCLGLILLAVVSMVGGSLLNGWALSVLWGWFIVPLFHAPVLPIVYAIGLSLTVNYLLSRYTPETKEQKERTIGEKVTVSIAYTIFTPLFAVGIGYIVHSFI